jgi:hypothetical protein
MKHSQEWHRKKCVTWAKKEAIRLADGKCQRCGRAKKNGYVMHGSHIHSEGTYKSMSADVDNILCLCYQCHFYWWHSNPLEASKWFNSRFPKLARRLNQRIKKIKIINWEKKHKCILLHTKTSAGKNTTRGLKP